jgi:hypothetical protein
MGFLSDAAEVFKRGLATQRRRASQARSSARLQGKGGRQPIPMELGSYEVATVIGGEGDLVLLKAWDSGAARWVMLAALPLENGLDASERLGRMARLHRVADPLAAVRHENVLEVYGLEYHQGWGCVVAEYLEGVRLAELLDAGETLAPSQVAPLGAALASVIAVAEESGIGPIDLDPAQVVLTSSGEIKVCSLCRGGGASERGVPSGGLKASGLSTLGALLYRCLTGRRPSLQAAEAGSKRRAVTPISAFRPSVPPDLERIIMGLMIFDTDEVRLSASVVVGGLERVVKQHGWTWQAPKAAAGSEPAQHSQAEERGGRAIPA